MEGLQYCKHFYSFLGPYINRNSCVQDGAEGGGEEYDLGCHGAAVAPLSWPCGEGSLRLRLC